MTAREEGRTIQIDFDASTADAVGQPRVEIRLAQKMRLLDLVSILLSMYPRLTAALPPQGSPSGLAGHLELDMDGRPVDLEEYVSDENHLSVRSRRG